MTYKTPSIDESVIGNKIFTNILNVGNGDTNNSSPANIKGSVTEGYQLFLCQNNNPIDGWVLGADSALGDLSFFRKGGGTNNIKTIMRANGNVDVAGVLTINASLPSQTSSLTIYNPTGHPAMRFVDGTDINYGHLMISLCRADGAETASLGVNNYVGDGLEFRSDGIIRMYIGRPPSGAAIYLDEANYFRPSVANGLDLGSAGARWSTVYCSALNNSSDSRLKTSIQTCEYGLDFILALKPVSYFKDTMPGKERPKEFGFVAQDIESIVASNTDFISQPEGDEGFYGLRYTELLAPLVKAVQEQQVMIKSLQDQIIALESKNS
jgi:hypothetical protein